MKKFLFFIVALAAFAFTSCTKDNSVQPTTVKAKTLADDNAKQDIGQADGAKQDIGQADGGVAAN
ncbi:hypothetical protein MUY27_14520 [Mucilaginibacter sp. RS28]|uniref:Entericidin n=1 Tax=Mucilaginibacter straminoryzae TaxID=2932774 RepID=A0A9X2B9R0_9SPHI|nr:hypothetical protein [Mucilaginibacter straminoryzae]MCJ8210929.1 hypothetical protein [Mucilaginibacter straminoryzae]